MYANHYSLLFDCLLLQGMVGFSSTLHWSGLPFCHDACDAWYVFERLRSLLTQIDSSNESA
jgi:hypothetical protein